VVVMAALTTRAVARWASSMTCTTSARRHSYSLQKIGLPGFIDWPGPLLLVPLINTQKPKVYDTLTSRHRIMFDLNAPSPIRNTRSL